jgi:prepilin-type processing-associated H-X9-DG protein
LKTPGVVLGADASSLYGTTVDTSDLVAKKALVELDRRLTSAAVPSYTNDVVLAGRVVNSGTSAGQTGAEVVVTGPSNVLFFDGNVYKRGSITVHSNASGNFSVTLYSTTAQTDTVITVTSMGKSATSKVTFTGIGVGEGKSLVITAPASVAPASTLQVKAKLTDTYGNAVQASAGRIKMTYTGAGIGFGTLPDSTDKNGELSYSVLLGAGDEGTITVVVSYDQNGDGDFVDTDDLSTTKTITVGAVEAEVNAVIGSFQGRWAVRVENAKGSTVTVKVGGKWYKYVSLNDNYTFSRKSKVGATVPVKVWVDGLLQNDQTITIK